MKNSRNPARNVLCGGSNCWVVWCGREGGGAPLRVLCDPHTASNSPCACLHLPLCHLTSHNVLDPSPADGLYDTGTQPRTGATNRHTGRATRPRPLPYNEAGRGGGVGKTKTRQAVMKLQAHTEKSAAQQRKCARYHQVAPRTQHALIRTQVPQSCHHHSHHLHHSRHHHRHHHRHRKNHRA
jgi:hypothetical protein